MKIIRVMTFLIVVGVAGMIYAFTLCPTVEFIDSGELALACKNLGIAHPTGYPLYTILGRLAAMLLGGSLIVKMNLMSLFFSAAAAGVLALTAIELLSANNHDFKLIALVSGSVSSFTALTPLWWAQGTTNEVYALNLLLISLFIFCFFKYLKGIDNRRWLILSSYTLGLAFTNHLSALYLVPGFAVILGWQVWRKRVRIVTLLRAAAFFSFPLTIYLFLPIRAGFSPFLNWGGVDDSYFLYKHISGWQYRIWMFSDADFGVVAGRLIYSAELLLKQFGWFGIAAAIVGLFSVYARHKRFGLFLLLIAIFNLLYASNYQIADIDSYYLPMIMVISIFMAAGLFFIAGLALKSGGSGKAVKISVVVVLLVLPLWNFFDNFFEANRKNRTFARQGAVDLVESMKPEGLAIVENWDFYSPWLYLAFEEQYRPDIVLLDKELMRRSWYIDFVRRSYPDIYSRSRTQIELFLDRVESFERNRRFDPQIIDSAYYGMLKAIVLNESALRPVYSNVSGDPKFARLLRFVPDGILFRIHDSNGFLESPSIEFDRSYWGNRFVYREERVGQLLTYYRNAFKGREAYCRYFGKADEAEHYRQLAVEADSIIRELQ